jgi:hypothetical protein
MGQGPPSPNTCENGIEFKNLGNVTDYIINSSFNKGYGCILGIDSTNGIKFENNLLFHNHMPALVLGSGNVLRNNLFVSSSGSHPKFLGDSIIAENNFLVGVSFVYRGDICLNNQITNFNHSIKNNTIYAGNVIVAGIDLEYGIFSFDCLRISNFTVYKGSLGQFAAITYKGASQIVIDSNILIDNQLSIGAYILKPASTSHIGMYIMYIRCSLLTYCVIIILSLYLNLCPIIKIISYFYIKNLNLISGIIIIGLRINII